MSQQRPARTSSRASRTAKLNRTWRPKSRQVTCGYTFRGRTCRKKGSHYCEPRADKVVAFFDEILVHTKGVWARKAFTLEPWQEWEIVRPLFGEVVYDDELGAHVRRYRLAYIVLGRKNGKALALDTPIPTPDGWRSMGDLEPGDLVYDETGAPTAVIAATEVMTDRPCYEVNFSDGTSVVADAEHLWVTEARRGGIAGRTTAEIAATVEAAPGERNHSIPVAPPLFGLPAWLIIKPYTLGAWLGDGTSANSGLTCADDGIVDRIRDDGYEIHHTKGLHWWITGLNPALRHLNLLGNKHVPSEYLRAPESDRLALLQGLMDTDGHCSKAGQCEFTTTSPALRDGVLELIRSLGYKPTMKESRATIDGRDCGPKWRIQFWGYRDRPVFALERKASRLRPAPARRTRSQTRQIVAVEQVDSVPVRCIQVAADSGMYLAGSGMVPTHNSEMVAGMVLYLLIGDDEEAAEVYGAAKDTKQAGKVGEVVNRMRELSPLLNGDSRGGRLARNKTTRRIYDPKTASYFEIATADALGELGHNPHAAYIDEVLSQPNGDLFHALRTAMGTRHQPMMLLVTTETNQPKGFGAKEIDEAERVQADPKRADHIFAFVRKMPRTADDLAAIRAQFRGHPDLPVSTDPWDERNWRWPNPALGSFKRIGSMREEAIEARNDPAKENAFRQFELNQRVQQVSRWMTIDRWDACPAEVVEDDLVGRRCWAGLDLSATTDLTAWTLIFPPVDDEEPWKVLWRAWTPEAMLPKLDRYLAGDASVWARSGHLRITEGDWIDYQGDPDTGRSVHGLDGIPVQLAVHPQIRSDAERFSIVGVGYDPKEAASTAQFMQTLGLTVTPIYQGFGLTGGLKEIMRLVKAGQLGTGGHPVARWNAESAEVRTDDEERIKLVKPSRDAAGARVDLIAALASGLRSMQLADDPEPVVLEGSLIA